MRIKDDHLNGRVPESLIELSKDFSSRKDSREKLLKLYSVILYKQEVEQRRNKHREHPKDEKLLFIHLASSYFYKVIGRRYYKYLNFLKSHGYVSVKGRILDDFESKNGLFDDPRFIESYKVGSYSKGYRVNVLPNNNDPKISIRLIFDLSEAAKKNICFMKSIGIEKPTVSRDNYGFRLYHSLSTSYKDYLKNKGQFIYYDCKSSIPHHFRLLVNRRMKNSGLDHDPFLDLFNGDFYRNWDQALGLKLSNRDHMKEHFASIVYGKQNELVPIRRRIKEVFPVFYKTLAQDIGRYVTRLETKFVIDQCVSNISVEEVLTIHDGFIVHLSEEELVDVELESILPKDLGLKFEKDHLGSELLLN